MSAPNLAWPQETGELENHHFDSTAWNGLPFRGDDIVIATYAKSGTTWLQQIVSQLVFDGEQGLEVAEMSHWDGGAQTFVHNGTNGRWRDLLTEADCWEYEERAVAELGAGCAAWLASGARQ